MKGILIDKELIENLQKEYKNLTKQNLNNNNEEEKTSTLNIEVVCDEVEL